MMFAMANWCLAVVQGAIWSWVPLGFPSPAMTPMANVGEGPEFLRCGYAGAVSESVRVSCLGVGN